MTDLPAKCRHFNGIQHSHCEAGVAYANVKDTESRPYKFPCLAREVAGRCASVSYFTTEELQAQEDEIAQLIEQVINRRANWICIHCATPMTAEQQIGRCVYAVPCGCRQSQGKARGKRSQEGLSE